MNKTQTTKGMKCVSASPHMKADQDQPPLLKLPGELRNHIHTYVLVEVRRVVITSTGISEPALLCVSRQIRDEGLSIYYGLNSFQVRVSNYDSTVGVLWKEKRDKLHKTHKLDYGGELAIEPRPRDDPNWANLITWFRRVYEDKVRGVYIPSPVPTTLSMEILLIGGMFAMVSEMRDVASWAKVEKVLEEQRKILARIDQRWNEASRT